MTPRLRPDLDRLPGYVPGRSVPDAIKLASNENPDQPLPGVIDAITHAATTANRYPDSPAKPLVARLAERFDVAAEQVAVGCGSVTLCQQLIQATCDPGDEVLYAWRSFEAYPVLTHVCAARSVQVPLRADRTHDPDAMLAAIGPATRLVFVCNPNNPTGTAWRRDELVRFLDAVPDGVLVALDEAYREYVTDPDVPSGVTLLPARDNVVVLRTFSKAFSLAGLRVGYAIGPPPVITALRRVFVPFGVSSIAQAAALASLDAADELLARSAAVATERDRVAGELRGLGYDVPDSQANFVWLQLGQHTEAFDRHCAEQSVVVRAFLDDGVRVTLGTPAANAAFLAAARSFTLDHAPG